MVSDLPTVVQKWILNSGVIGKKAVSSVYLEQDIQMLMKPEQKKWMDATAKQYFTTYPPAFNWSVSVNMNPFLNVIGRDKFEDGKNFYTWMGGILPAFRKNGIATALAKKQEAWIKQNDFQNVILKTRNKHQGMLIFAIKNRFKIIEIEARENIDEHRIILKKAL